MKGLDINKLKQEKNLKIISSKEALKDVIPINWSENVLNGERKVEISNSFDNMMEAGNQFKAGLNLTNEEVLQLIKETCGDIKVEDIEKNEKLLDVLKRICKNE